jgi:exodeoxyribonuclease VII small subunit
MTEIGYEAARAELADIVRRLETGGQSLEESLALWQRGEELADTCQRWLAGATARLDAAIAARDADRAEPETASGSESGPC